MIAVPSAERGLTSLFGKGRGAPPSKKRLKTFRHGKRVGELFVCRKLRILSIAQL